MGAFRVPSQLHRIVWLLPLAAALLHQPGDARIITVDGSCTLADAILAANTDTSVGECPAGSGADEIVLTADVLLTEAADGFNALPPIDSDVTIEGNGFRIERDPSAPRVRVLQVTSGLVELRDTTLQGGHAYYGVTEGGGLRVLAGQTTLLNSTVTGNDADLGGGLVIELGGEVTLVNSTVSSNFAQTAGGVHSRGELTMILSSVSNNEVYVGAYAGLSCCAGINNQGDLTLISSTVSGNDARGGYTGDIGGIASGSTGATLTIIDSTISDNTAEQYIGGISAYSATIVNSTISGNGAYYSWLSPSPGALWVSGPVTIENTTIAGNRTVESNPAIYVEPGGSLTLTNSILGGNDLPNCGGAVVDGGNNLADDQSCGAGFATLTGLDPVLQDNGGPTPTHALAFDSSARDAAGSCASENDQRGFPRDDAACDSGSFEFGAELFPITIDGQCPGALTVTATGTTPNAPVELFEGPSAGSTAIPDGPCAGRGIDLASPQRIAIFPADGAGVGSVELNVVAADCGQLLQAVDTDSCVTSSVGPIDSCDPLTLDHTGAGTDPVASPTSSPGCASGEYEAGEPITLTAMPDPSWAVGSWTGTDDDAGTDPVNSLTMPAGAHSVTVNYQQVCFALALTHTGSGSDPIATPPSSAGCPASTYAAGEVVDLSGALPDPGWSIAGWTGTDDDSSTQSTNSVTMTTAHRIVRVHYVLGCHDLTLEHTGQGGDPVVSPLGDGDTFAEHPVASGFDSAAWAAAGDIDGDGDPDILGGSILDGVDWWENTQGDGSAWSRSLVSGPFQAGSVFLADIDGDGDADGLGSSVFSDEIVWWRNSGNGTFWQELIIDDSLLQARSAVAADIDTDGDLDIVGAGSLANEVKWYENTAGNGSAWTEHPVSGFFDDAYSAVAADVDGDGDPDVLAAGLDGDTVAWFENTAGDGTAWAPRIIDAAVDGAISVFGADIDGDDDIDVLAAAILDDQVLWWENTNGDGSAWTEHTVASSFDGARTVYAADMDGDRDIDVLASATGSDSISWWENQLGDGTTWLEHPVAANFNGATSVSAADLDQDSDPDVLSVASVGDEITWWENVYDGTCPAGSFNAGDRLALTAAPDPGWEVAGWTGTEDDQSGELTNTALMPAMDHTVAVDYVQTGSGFTLSATGSCPGQITVTVTTPEPNERVKIFAGAGPGSTTLPGGSCAGTELAIAAARRWRNVTTDGNGEATLVETAPSALCGRSLQALDRDCATSNVVPLP